MHRAAQEEEMAAAALKARRLPSYPSCVLFSAGVFRISAFVHSIAPQQMQSSRLFYRLN